MKKARYHVLDAVRGIAIVGMLIYHYFYDLTYFFHQNSRWIFTPSAELFQTVVAFLFILISGMLAHVSKNNGLRGLQLLTCGLVVNAVSYFYLPQSRIVFGILTFLGTASLAIYFFQRFLVLVEPRVGALCSFLLYVLTYTLPQGKIMVGNWLLVVLPEALYQYYWLAPFGFPSVGFVSADYFPLLPWFFIYLLGFYVWLSFSETFKNTHLTYRIPLLSCVGRQSLVIYFLHQPVILFVLMLWYK
ncbi:MAG TPA: DUF1624 domain-containing protein [Candidatus Avacidaminococcus intestinavium]|uniref:DUF1624 domain-containing protein n=1 Tax=Candidatus Avacidaminococcus intestinavium TaxID=2840684 RepID=A0A9D1MP67_9FIRM|nr:DUF1624 domain-containing protein [Candidatus Avacidaminococcus intestinavium]